MRANAARSPDQSIAVSVVPIRRAGAAEACRATSRSASVTARPRTWSMVPGVTSASCERSDSITAALATSPAACPPQAVGHREQPAACISRVLVVLPDQAGLASSSGRQGERRGHFSLGTSRAHNLVPQERPR